MKNKIVVDKFIRRLSKDTEPVIVTIRQLNKNGRFGKVLEHYLRFADNVHEVNGIYHEAVNIAFEYYNKGYQLMLTAEYVDNNGDFIKDVWKLYNGKGIFGE